MHSHGHCLLNDCRNYTFCLAVQEAPIQPAAFSVGNGLGGGFLSIDHKLRVKLLRYSCRARIHCVCFDFFDIRSLRYGLD